MPSTGAEMKVTCVVLALALYTCVQSLPMTLLGSASTPLKFKDVWSDCSKPGDGAKLDKLVLSPDPPVKGEKLTINFTVTIFEQVTSGTILLEAKFGNFPAFKGAFDWCDVVKDLAPCPTKPGTYSKSATIDIMATLPSGNYTGHATATDQNKKELACINVKLTL